MDVLNESEVTAQRLESMFSAAFMQCAVDDDGDLKVEDRGLRVFIRIGSESKVITFFSIWGLKQGGLFSDEKKLAFVNKLNNEYRLVRFSMPKPEKLWCDYQLLYEGGISPYQIVNTFRLFSQVCKGVAADDEDDFIA